MAGSGGYCIVTHQARLFGGLYTLALSLLYCLSALGAGSSSSLQVLSLRRSSLFTAAMFSSSLGTLWFRRTGFEDIHLGPKTASFVQNAIGLFRIHLCLLARPGSWFDQAKYITSVFYRIFRCPRRLAIYAVSSGTPSKVSTNHRSLIPLSHWQQQKKRRNRATSRCQKVCE